MSEFEQTLLFATTTLILTSTLVIFAVRYFRDKNRDD